MSGLPADHEQFARAALRHYGMATTSSLTLLSLSENATYLAADCDVDRQGAVGQGATRQGRGQALVLRVHRPGYHPIGDIESELAWMAAVAADTPVRTPRPVRTRTGDALVTVSVANAGTAERSLVVDAVSVIDGRTAEDPDTMVGFAEIGALTAELHRHARSWEFPPGFRRFRWDVASILGPQARWGDWRMAPHLAAEDRADVERAAAEVSRRLHDYGMGPHRFGLIHADLRLANLMVPPQGADGLTVIDFDDCGWSWFFYDAGAALSFLEEDPRAADLLHDWLDGYASVLTPTAAEVAMLSTFVMLRRIHLTAWFASHPTADTTRALGADFVAGTARLARRYLDDPSWLQFPFPRSRHSLQPPHPRPQERI